MNKLERMKMLMNFKDINDMTEEELDFCMENIDLYRESLKTSEELHNQVIPEMKEAPDKRKKEKLEMAKKAISALSKAGLSKKEIISIVHYLCSNECIITTVFESAEMIQRKEYLIQRENIRERFAKEEQTMSKTLKKNLAKATSQDQLDDLNKEFSEKAAKKRDKYFRLMKLLREKYPNWKFDWD